MKRGVSVLKRWTINARTWLEPELFQPFVFGVLISLTMSGFVRGALTLSLLPTYGQTVLGIAVEWTALSLSIHYLTDNLLRAPSGWLCDRMGQRPVLLIGFLISAASVFLMMNVRSVWMLFLATALYGVGVTPMWPAAITGITRTTPEGKRGAFMSYIYMFGLVGTGLGQVLINVVIGTTYFMAFWILITFEVVGFLLVWWLVKVPSNNATPAHSTSLKSRARHSKAYWIALWGNIKEVGFLFPGMFAQTFAVALLMPLLALYAKVVLRLSGIQYSSLLILGGGVTMILLIPAGKIVDRFRPRRFLVTSFILTGTCLCLLPLHRTVWATFVSVSCIGVCYAFIIPSWNKVLDDGIDADKKGTLWGVFMTVEGLGSALGPYVGGLLWDAVSPAAPFWLSSAVIIIMGLLYLILPIDRKISPISADVSAIVDERASKHRKEVRSTSKA